MQRKLVLATLGPVLLPALSAACSGSSYAEEYAAYQQCIANETRSLTASSAPAVAGKFGGGLEVSDEASVVAVLRASIKSAARLQLDARRVGILAEKRCEDLYPTRSDDDASFGSPTRASAESPNAGGGDGASAKEASGTNNQVANVDEADFVKNDNEFIYVTNGSYFRIVDAFPGADMRELSRVKINGKAKKLFVEGNRAVVYSSLETPPVPSGRHRDNWWASGYGGGGGECTYGQNGCVPSGDGSGTEIAIFDLTDRTRPALLRTIRTSSSFVAARRVGSAVHTVLAQPSPLVIPAPTVSVRQDEPEARINEAYAQALVKTEADIDAQVITGSVMPTWTDSASLPIASGLYRSASPDGDSITSLLTLDLAQAAGVSVTSIVSSPGWTYASGDALYLAVPHERGGSWGWFDRSEDELTTVHKFTLAPASSAYFGSGFVTGRVLNQLAMDEQNGFLRLATTAGHLPSPTAKNLLTVLEPQSTPAGNTLATVGKIDDIAPTEDIRSARFDGDRGYIVTFKKTDPLYVFDLADPRAPRILGELKIPGFSTYMHMMDATHLLTIGYDAADKGDFAYFTGIMLQIFDVSNPADPKLTHKEVIGSRGTSSEAATNHLAFTYFAPKNLLALPMTVCEGGNENGGYGTKMTFSGLMVYDVTAEGGFQLRGRVAHPSVTEQPTNDYGYYDASCSNWWTNANSEVKRSIIMDDWVYSVSESRIKANTLHDLAQDVREVDIADPQEQVGDRF